MRQQGLRGIRRGKQFVTTRPDSSSTRAPDHVQRCFRADRPNELWVVDFTYVPTWSRMVFTAFVTDVYSRRIVGWRSMDRMPTDLPLDALEMALRIRDRAGEDVTGVIQHSDAGSQGGFNWSSQHLVIMEVFGWFDGSKRQIVRYVPSFVPRGIRSSNVPSRQRFGRRSPKGCCPSRLLPWSAWRKRSVSGGSVTLAVCRRSM